MHAQLLRGCDTSKWGGRWRAAPDWAIASFSINPLKESEMKRLLLGVMLLRRALPRLEFLW